MAEGKLEYVISINAMSTWSDVFMINGEFENNNQWHHSIVSKKIFDDAILELEKNHEQL